MATDCNGKEIKAGNKVKLLIDLSFSEYTATKDSVHIVDRVSEISQYNHFYVSYWSLPCLGSDVELVEDKIVCTCDIMTLMRAGCKCGAIQKERESC